ncbi:MAG: TolC family outer membrane protein [Magnetococcus sp. DMHC-6]
MQRRSSLFLAATLLCSFLELPARQATAADVSSVFQFRTFIQSVLETQPAILSAKADLKAAQEQTKQTAALLLPSVHLNASQSYNQTDWNHDTSKSNPEEVGVSLTQPVYNRATWLAHERAKPYVALYEADLNAAQQNLLWDIIQVTLDFLQAQEVAKLAKNNQEVLKNHLASTQARYQVGEITQTDVRQAEARLAQARAKQIGADNAVQTSRARFQEIIGTTPPIGLMVPKVVQANLKFSSEKREALLETRPDIRALQERLKYASLSIEIEEAGYLPEVSLSTSLNRDWNDGSNRGTPVDQFSISVGLKLPLYSGGMTVSRIDQKRAEKEALAAQLDLNRLQAMREIESAELSLTSTQAETVAYQSSVTAAQEALNGFQSEYEVGSRTALDLLDAQNTLFSAQTDLAKSHYDEIRNQYQLLLAMGQLRLEFFDIEKGALSADK